MSKLHYIEKARKSYKKEGIKKGQPYWWYVGPRPRTKGSRGETIKCAFKPRRSLYATRSEYIGGMMDAEDDLNADFLSNHESVVERLRELCSSCQEKLDNMNETHFNGSSTADLLQSRVDACERIVEEIERIALEVNDETSEEEVRSEVDSIDWSYE
jgi:hypothetical protein